MNKFRLKILITVFMVAIFVVPFSLDIKTNNNKHLAIEVKINKTQADQFDTYRNILPDSSVKLKNSSQSVAEFSVNIKGPQTDWDKAYFVNVNSITGQVGPAPKTIVLVIMENGKYINYYDFSTDISKVTTSSYSFLSWTPLKPQIDDQYIDFSVGGLTAGKTYTAELYYVTKGNAGAGGGIDLFESTNKNFYKFGKSTSFPTPNPSPDDVGGVITGDFPVIPNGNDTYTPAAKFNCSIIPANIPGCIAQVFYSLSEVTSWVARLAGSFLDFFVYYSTNSSSYSNLFVEKGWSAIRDVANIFFIVALLFIAIKTILNLNVTNNKKLLGTIVMIALIINFSLFTTKVVIDGSNILAKIFYNNISSKDVEKPNAEGSVTGQAGEKSLSIGLVDKFNPQQLLMTIYDNGNGLGLFIFVILLLMAITLYTAYIFFSVALLFVARVITLWMSMIFSPIAFASYTLPFEIPGFGHKEWWDTLLKTAFMAPLFIFMLYIIILFSGFLTTIAVYADSPNLSGNENVAQHLMSIIIPFIILMMLLRMSKTLAVKYSGEMGKAVMTGAKMIGGVALGAVTGGAAILGSGAIGNLASRAASSKGLQDAAKETGFKGAIAKMALRSADYGSKASFDVRKIAGVGALAKASGLNLESTKAIGLGSKEGGYTQRRKEQVEKKQKRAKELEVREDEPLKQALNKTEIDLQGLLSKNTQNIEAVDKIIEKKREEARDASTKFTAARGTTGEATARTDLQNANSNLDSIKQAKKDLREGRAYSHTDIGAAVPSISGVSIGTATHNIDSLEKQQKTDAQAIKTENVERRQLYAEGIIKWGLNDIRTDREAAHKIITEVKLDSGTKT